MMSKAAYFKQRYCAKERGIEWNFTFRTWCEVWEHSGHQDQRGRGKGKYVMARINDAGPYAKGNVEIVLHEKNAKDSHLFNPNTTKELSLRLVGKGRGWTFARGAYQVSVAKKYVGRFPTPALAEVAYAQAVEARKSAVCGGRA